LFHKALIDEDNDMTRINQYLQMVRQTNDREQLQMKDAFDRSIYLAFDLVLQQQLNPWNIDLVQFSTMYLKKAKEQDLDLLTAGRIIYMAWKVLRLQSDDLVINMEAKQEEDDLAFGWEDLPTGTWMENDDGYSYTNLIMKLPDPPLEEPVRREAKRKITLIELLQAFDTARKDAEEYQLVDRLRREERLRLSLNARKAMKGTTHEDHLEEDIGMVWKKIQGLKKKSISLTELYDSSDPEEHIKTFLSVLFLVYAHKVRVYQRQFPYGKIFIKMVGYT
jgi:segregation and condensation protein A